MAQHFPTVGILSLFVIILVAGNGCSTVRTYDDRFKPVYASYTQGNFEAAAKAATRNDSDRRYRSSDRLLWTMESGKLLHATHEFEKSNRYFERAEEIVREFEERPELNVRAGAAQLSAIATNPNALPYQGSYADRIMINTYKAMNYLALGDLEAARVEIRRSYERQRQALTENDAAIERAKQQARSDNLPSTVFDNPDLRRAAPVDPASARAYADFANPFTTFLSGLVYLADQDPVRAEVDFRLLASLPISNSYVQYELDRIQRHLDGETQLAGRRVYVIFENGLGPRKKEMRVDLILPNLGYTGFAFPEVVFQPSPVRGLSISQPGDGPRFFTEQIASMDQVVATEFQTRMPSMVMRTITSVIAKEVAANQLTKQLDGIGLLLGSLYKALVNRADTRTWNTLGKEFQVAALDYPENGNLRLSLTGRNKSELSRPQTVELPDGDFILVLVQSVNQHDLRITVQSLR